MNNDTMGVSDTLQGLVTRADGAKETINVYSVDRKHKVEEIIKRRLEKGNLAVTMVFVRRKIDATNNSNEGEMDSPDLSS